MRTVQVMSPSFPDVPPNRLLEPRPQVRWQVLCGDPDHWRAGLWSPPETQASHCTELEQHTCPELFLLLEGHITLLLFEDGRVRELPLEPGRPVLVTAPHAGYCPHGPHTGVAFVVERDLFSTLYRTPAEWEQASP